jgi:enolase
MPKLTKIFARQVFDSRGTPTLEADVTLEGGFLGRFSVPSGASTGMKEALELRDNEAAFFGKGVKKALSHIQGEISQKLLNKDFAKLEELDQLLIDLDATENKSRLGANAILAVSGAFFKALSLSQNRPLYDSLLHKKAVLPMPLINVINGGVHANNGLNIQEFMVVPLSATSFARAMQMASELFMTLRRLLASKGHSVAVGDEGGFAPRLKSHEEALDLLCASVEQSGYRLGDDFAFALDAAANEFFDSKNNYYIFAAEKFSSEELSNWYKNICIKYPLVSIEDPFHEEDKLAFKYLTKELGKKVQIVGDDLCVTNEKFILPALKEKAINAVLIKMNQVGTVSETLRAIKLTEELGARAIISHRSGETEDTTIADLVVLTGAGQIKSGSMSRSERVAKYNRLLRIEEELGERAQFLGFPKREDNNESKNS